MSSIALLFPQAKKGVHEIQIMLESLERAHGEEASKIQKTIERDLAQAESNIQGLEKQVSYESATKREVWRRRVLALRDECQHLRQSVDRYSQHMFQTKLQQEEREALLARPVGSMSNNYSSAINEGNSLDNSLGMIDGLLGQGRGAMVSLQDQGGTLKAAHQKVMDIAQTLGLSQSLLKVIGRREWTDRWLVYVGMVLTLIVLFVCWHYRGK